MTTSPSPPHHRHDLKDASVADDGGGPTRKDEMLRDVPCPLCHSHDRDAVYLRHHVLPGLGEVPISVVQCQGCGFLYNSPLPLDGVLESYYADSSLASGQVYRNEGATGHYSRLHAERAGFVARFVGEKTAGRLLDIGCGVGSFLQALSERPALSGWTLYGLDPSSAACANAADKGFSITKGMLGDAGLEPNSFDALTMISVLEHIQDPRRALQDIRDLVKPGGVAILEVPNVTRPAMAISSYFSFEHLQHFSPWTFYRSLREAGWNHVVLELSEGSLRAAVSDDPMLEKEAPLYQGRDDREEVAEGIKDFYERESVWLKDSMKGIGPRLERWHGAGLRVAIYGAGVHTLALSQLIDFTKYAGNMVIVDGDAKKQGKSFLGMRVIAPEEMKRDGVDCVVVSSQRFSEEMVANVRSILGDDTEINVFY